MATAQLQPTNRSELITATRPGSTDMPRKKNANATATRLFLKSLILKLTQLPLLPLRPYRKPQQQNLPLSPLMKKRLLSLPTKSRLLNQLNPTSKNLQHPSLENEKNPRLMRLSELILPKKKLMKNYLTKTMMRHTNPIPKRIITTTTLNTTIRM